MFTEPFNAPPSSPIRFHTFPPSVLRVSFAETSPSKDVFTQIAPSSSTAIGIVCPHPSALTNKKRVPRSNALNTLLKVVLWLIIE
jgi:hypothetical protein